jgi:hypothetical protein
MYIVFALQVICKKLGIGTQRSMERCMLGITRRDRKRNTWVRSITTVADIAECVKKLNWTHSGKNGWLKYWNGIREDVNETDRNVSGLERPLLSSGW